MEKNASGNMTVFGRETEFDGVLEFADSLVITGKFSGSIQAGGALEIEKGAVCDVDTVRARSVIVGGELRGNIYASERVEMNSGSTVHGDIQTARLRIADNVSFDGQVAMLEEEPEIDLFSAASDEFKRNLVLKGGAA